MVDSVKVGVGGSLADDLAAFRSAWKRAERGEAVEPEIVVTFERLGRAGGGADRGAV